MNGGYANLAKRRNNFVKFQTLDDGGVQMCDMIKIIPIHSINPGLQTVCRHLQHSDYSTLLKCAIT